VDEKLTLIRRLNLESTLAAALKQVLLVETAESSSPKAALVARKHISRIVGGLGFGQLPPPQRRSTPASTAGELSSIARLSMMRAALALICSFVEGHQRDLHHHYARV
jgi:hypothetical protein